MTSADPRVLRYAFMKLAREFDSRFGKLLLGGRVAKWYSEVGNEATTVAAGLTPGPGDVLCTLHRDLGAILARYVDPARAFPNFGFGDPDSLRPEPQELLFRLTSQLLGRDTGFSRGVERALEADMPKPETARRSVFAPTDPVSQPSPDHADSPVAEGAQRAREYSYIEAIHQALLDEMTVDSSVVLMGQDIAVFEGAFRATKGLHQKWPDRVLDTPIAESGTLGVAIGASLLGYRPVVEMHLPTS